MNAMTPREAQRVVAAYLEVVEKDATADVYPCSADTLPQPKEIIREAFRTCITTLAANGDLTAELRDYLEVAYVSLADYVDAECFALLREYGRAGEALAAGSRIAKDKVATDAWRRLLEQSRLAGELARAISDDADCLRAEFRSWGRAEGGKTDVDVSSSGPR